MRCDSERGSLTEMTKSPQIGRYARFAGQVDACDDENVSHAEDKIIADRILQARTILPCGK